LQSGKKRVVSLSVEYHIGEASFHLVKIEEGLDKKQEREGERRARKCGH